MPVRLLAPLTEISVKPDFNGLPSQVQAGLIHLTNNLAGLLLLVSGIGIVVSLLGWVVGAQLGYHHLVERSKSSLVVSVGAGALLYVSVAAANYTLRLFS